METSVSTTLGETRRAVDWRSMFLSIASAPKNERVRMMAAIGERMAIPYGTIRRKFYAYMKPAERNGGLASLVDRRKARVYSAKNDWLGAYMYFIENDKNTSRGGYRAMMEKFRSGAVLPILGKTWRQVWAEEHRGESVPTVCPDPWDWTPKGATYANLQAAAKRNPDYQFSIVANRHGMAAARQFVRTVLTTRVGLHVGEKFEFDDVWHNIDIRLPSGRVCQPLEFAGYDIASGFKAMSCMKPRFERADGTRDNLKEFQFRCGLAHLLMRTGFYKGGVELVVEHGTTAIRDRVEKQIRGIAGVGELIRFSRSGILSEQVHAGLFAGMGGGNFKMKAFCEGAHNVLHNREASLIGNKGRDRVNLHESQPALVKYEEKIAAIAATLPIEFQRDLLMNLMTFEEYAAAFQVIEAGLMDDPWHRLEGWDGKIVKEWRMNVGDPWKPVGVLMDETPERALAIATLVGNDPRLTRVRPMSRREAWKAGQRDLVKVDDWYMPHFLDVEKDAKVLTVGNDGRFSFTDQLYYGRDEMLYRAIVRGREGWTEHLCPGKKILVCWNPFIAEKVWVMDAADGHILGTCALDSRAAQNDRHAIERAMGEQAHELKRLVEPIRGRHLDAAVGRATLIANNARVVAAARGAAAKAPAAFGSGEGATLDELATAAPCADVYVGGAADEADGEDAATGFLDEVTAASRLEMSRR